MYNVLIVEDHDRLREQLGQFYEQEGFGVTTASSGEEGIQKLAEENFAIVVSDIKMPGMDGFQLARHVREKHPDTDVILITAFGNIELAVEALKAGAFDFVSKPVDLTVLRGLVKHALELNNSERAPPAPAPDWKRGFDNQRIADLGEVMPPKTTYFAPKPYAGIFLT